MSDTNPRVLSVITEMSTFLEEWDPSDDDVSTTPIDTVGKPIASMDKLMEELESIFTPVLAMQAIDTDVSDRVKEACSQENVLSESNIIQFDDDTKKAQLVSLCALLISRNANDDDYQAYKQAAKVQKTMKLKIQRDRNAEATALADEYLKKTASTANSPEVRNAADHLSHVGSPLV